MLIKQKSPSLLRNLAIGTFGKLPIVFSAKKNLLYCLSYTAQICYTAQRCCLLHLIRQNCLLKSFPRTLILMIRVSFYLFSFLELIRNHKISISPKMVKKAITNLDSSKASGPDCIPVVVVKSCEPELSYILVKLFNMCLKQSCFPDCWKVSLVVPLIKNAGERSTAKNYCPVSLLFKVSKVLEKLVNNPIVDYLEKYFSSMVLCLFDQLQIF